MPTISSAVAERMPRMPQKYLAGKVCLVAGASGAIGSAVSKLFHQEGAKLGLTYLSQEPAPFHSIDHTVAEHTIKFPLDLRDRKQIDEAVDRVVHKFGRLDILVNCTGVLGPIGPSADVSIDDWIEAVNINLIGSFRLTRAVLPGMLTQGSGKIIHFSGGGAAYARPFFTSYSTSKAALVRFVESLAGELKEHHIDINTIAPGAVNSRMWNQMRSSGDAGGASTITEIKKMEETGGVPPERAADLAAFLASELSDGLSGRLISAIHDD